MKVQRDLCCFNVHLPAFGASDEDLLDCLTRGEIKNKNIYFILFAYNFWCLFVVCRLHKRINFISLPSSSSTDSNIVMVLFVVCFQNTSIELNISFNFWEHIFQLNLNWRKNVFFYFFFVENCFFLWRLEKITLEHSQFNSIA